MSQINTFKLVLLTTLFIKLLLAYALPLSGDEAYFVLWAQHLDFGYYDHPPMVGWFLHLMLYLGHSEVILRLPAIMTSTLIGIGIYQLLKPLDDRKAKLVAILFLLSPLNVLNVLITTDTPLILFAFMSMASLYKALQQNKYSWYALSGVFFGLAFLSKYFAVLLGLAYLAYWILSNKNINKSKGFVLLFLASLPFALVNIYWNYTHCWDNILFNLYTRNEGAKFSFGTLGVFFAVQIYLITPPLIYFLLKNRANVIQKIKHDQFTLFAFIFIIPLLIFTLLSFKKVVGLHWVLAFYPALYLMVFQFLNPPELIKTIKFMAAFTTLHLLIIIGIASYPLETWQGKHMYAGAVLMFDPEPIIEQIRPYEQQQFILATDGYSPSASMSYQYGKPFFVYGEGGLHARQDDMLTDFREFKGRNILVLSKSEPIMSEYLPYFKRVETKEFTLRGAPFYLVLGYEFNYEQYKEGVLRPIKHKYYKIPDYLPHAPCYFCEKYFPGE